METKQGDRRIFALGVLMVLIALAWGLWGCQNMGLAKTPAEAGFLAGEAYTVGNTFGVPQARAMEVCGAVLAELVDENAAAIPYDITVRVGDKALAMGYDSKVAEQAAVLANLYRVRLQPFYVQATTPDKRRAVLQDFLAGVRVAIGE